MDFTATLGLGYQHQIYGKFHKKRNNLRNHYTLAPDCDQHYTSTVRRRSQLNVKSCVLCVQRTSVVAANCVSSQ